MVTLERQGEANLRARTPKRERDCRLFAEPDGDGQLNELICVSFG